MTLYRLKAGGGFEMDGPDGQPLGPVFGLPYAEDDPFVVAKPQSFEPIPVDTASTAPRAAVSKRPPGRPPLTEGGVRADLKRALASLAAEGKTNPSWDALAAKHDGLTEFGLTVDALRKRRNKFPELFREMVPDLPE
jgi:hypothetical protein